MKELSFKLEVLFFRAVKTARIGFADRSKLPAVCERTVINRMEPEQLAKMAAEARRTAYAPYSGFTVGAALLCADGKVYTGCNIESASYSPTVCAERTAFFKAVSEGERNFTAIAIVGGRKNAEPELCPPCGVCRQVMMEFCDPGSFRIVLPEKGGACRVFTLEQLLPMSFGPKNLGE